MSRTWSYNGVDLEVNMKSPSFVEKYETAWNGLNNIPNTGKLSERIKRTIEAVDKVFDRMYGEGTAEKLFTDDDMDKRLDVLDSFLDAVVEDAKATNARISNMNSKYSPRKRR